jgi:hypothetical protein
MKPLRLDTSTRLSTQFGLECRTQTDSRHGQVKAYTKKTLINGMQVEVKCGAVFNPRKMI